ncbi:isochorismatase family protein [Prolixibacteraceae bacterium]|nr:isochorismatase family protein [Prolixibacteraceae bacterium]
MSNKPIVFWNIDTQYDFVDPHGALYVEGAERLISLWEEILDFVREHEVRLISTKDHHFVDSEELSDHPNYVSTFPPHCIAGDKGVRSVLSRIEENAVELPWNCSISENQLRSIYQDKCPLIILKDKFDFYEGNPNSKLLLPLLKEKQMYVFGVAENVCVSQAAIALAKKGFDVTVISDAVKGLSSLSTPYELWDDFNIKLKTWKDIKKDILL